MRTQPQPAGAARDTTRRAVLRGAAWSLPVVLVTAAAPAFAASPVSPFIVTGSHGLGNNADKLLLTFSSSTVSGSVTVVSVTQGTSTYTNFNPNPFSAPGTTLTQQGQSYTAGATYVVTYTFAGATYMQTFVAV